MMLISLAYKFKQDQEIVLLTIFLERITKLMLFYKGKVKIEQTLLDVWKMNLKLCTHKLTHTNELFHNLGCFDLVPIKLPCQVFYH
jgi:hypothetical protein